MIMGVALNWKCEARNVKQTRNPTTRKASSVFVVLQDVLVISDSDLTDFIHVEYNIVQMSS